MLFPIRPETTRSIVFEKLNQEIGCFLKSCVTAKRFGNGLFSDELRDAITNNQPTWEKFKELWDVIRPLDVVERTKLVSVFDASQTIQRYYTDKGYSLPTIRDDVNKVLAVLTKHLFVRSSGLVAIENTCNETLHENFDKFRNVNNNICCFCGASELAQVRAGVDVNDQWRAANDHLLAKKEYPIFAVHPDNLILICETCNSKAKLSKDLLNIKKKKHPDVRRLCFYPFIENCNVYVGIKVDQDKLRLVARFTMNAHDPDIQEKLHTWNDVYNIQERVEGKFTDLAVLVDSDCHADDLNEFRIKVQEEAEACKNNCRLETWKFWKYRLYEWLDNHGDVVDDLWGNILNKRSDADAASVYGI